MRPLYRVIVVALLISMVCVTVAYAADAPSTKGSMNAPGPVPIGAFTSALYDYALKIVGFCIFVMFLIAGLAYMIPALQKSLGNPIQIMQDAVIGLVILVSAYVILNSIHPNLVNIGAVESTGFGAGTNPATGAWNPSGGGPTPDYRPIPGGDTVIENGETKKNLGQVCAENAECVAGGACIAGKCAVAPTDSLGLGDRCVRSEQCKEELYCTSGATSEVKRCSDPVIVISGKDFTKAGAPCDISKRYCQPDHYCPDGTCVPPTQGSLPNGSYCEISYPTGTFWNYCKSGSCQRELMSSGLYRCVP